MFLMIILGTTDRCAPQRFALGKRGPPTPTACSSSWSSIAIGLGLTLIHLIWIPVTNLSVNPARRTASALLVGGWAVQQLWLFWVAPLAVRGAIDF
jgi:aquaporin Z